MAGSLLDETAGDNGRRLHVSRSGSKQKTGARAVTAFSYSNVKQPVLELIRDSERATFKERGRNEKESGFPKAPDLLILTSQRASGLRYPFIEQLELASRSFGYHRTLRQLRWARTVETGHCSGALGTNLCWCPPKLCCKPLLTMPTCYHRLFNAVSRHL